MRRPTGAQDNLRQLGRRVGAIFQADTVRQGEPDHRVPMQTEKLEKGAVTIADGPIGLDKLTRR